MRRTRDAHHGFITNQSQETKNLVGLPLFSEVPGFWRDQHSRSCFSVERRPFSLRFGRHVLLVPLVKGVASGLVEIERRGAVWGVLSGNPVTGWASCAGMVHAWVCTPASGVLAV